MTLTRREILAVLGGVSTVSLSRFFAEFDWLDVGEMVVDSIHAGEVNRTHQLDPDVADFGQAVSDTVAEMAAGDVLIVPPVDYETATEPLIDKPIHIIGEGVGTRFEGTENATVIEKTTDVWGLKCAEGVGIHVEGLEFVAPNVTDTTGGIKVRGSSTVRDVKGRDLGSHVVDLTQESGNDNLNLSQAQRISGFGCGGDVVHVENATTKTNNLNSCEVAVHDHIDNSGWAVNFVSGANASTAFVNSAQGTMTGVLRLGSQKCHGRVLRHEGQGPVVQFDNSGNEVEVLYDNTANGATWNNSNNTYKDLSVNTRENRYRRHKFAGANIHLEDDNGIDFTDENGNTINLFVDAGELKVTDSAGNTSTLS